MKTQTEAAEEGLRASIDDQPMFMNPYTPNQQPFPQLFVAWFSGWCEGEREKYFNENPDKMRFPTQ
jgi:hypothetical protein